MKKHITPLWVCGLLFFVMQSGTLIAQQSEYEKWLKQEQQRVEQFLSEEDKAFTEFLKQEWRDFQISRGMEAYEEPKFDDAPVYTPPPEEDENPTVPEEPEAPDVKAPEEDADGETPEEESVPEQPDEEVVPDEEAAETPPSPPKDQEAETPPEDEPEETPAITPEEEPEKTPPAPPEDETPVVTPPPDETPEEVPDDPVTLPTGPDYERSSFDFYGLEEPVAVPAGFAVRLNAAPGNESIAQFWQAMSAADYEPFLEQARSYRDKWALNDWGYIQVLNRMAHRIYPSSADNRHLFVWYLLNKDGYRVRVGLQGGAVRLFLPTVTRLYSAPYYWYSEKKEPQYVMNLDDLKFTDERPVTSYEEDFPGATKKIDMGVSTPPRFPEKLKTKTLKFYYDRQNWEVPVTYNANIVEFFKQYPQTDFDVYFKAEPDGHSRASLLKHLGAAVEGKAIPSAANLLMRFVQKSFDYATDDENFGREKPLFVEETLHYKRSDCEDRSVLFAFLVRELLGLKVVGLHYPGHMATAVKFPVNVPGDAVTFQGERYTVCDPTFINSYIGMAMPQFKNVEPIRIIPIN